MGNARPIRHAGTPANPDRVRREDAFTAEETEDLRREIEAEEAALVQLPVSSLEDYGILPDPEEGRES
jgi:hypothetical protein